MKVVYFASVCSMPQSSGMHEREACPSEGEVREKIYPLEHYKYPTQVFSQSHSNGPVKVVSPASFPSMNLHCLLETVA